MTKKRGPKYKFSKLSKANLFTAHQMLKKLFDQIIKTYDCSILEGHRNKENQNKAYRRGKSKLKWPRSKHNKRPSLAVDVAPYPIDWKDRKRFYHFGGYVKGVADQLKIKIRWGGDWDDDHDFKDQKFNDLVHFEIKR